MLVHPAAKEIFKGQPIRPQILLIRIHHPMEFFTLGASMNSISIDCPIAVM